MKYQSIRSDNLPGVRAPVQRHLTSVELGSVEARFGLRISARLNEQAMTLPHDISERLRVARETAIGQARLQPASAMRTSPQSVILGSGRGSALLGRDGGDSWWFKLSSMVPLLVLVAGLFLIQYLQGEEQILTAADVDAALLGDELPPDAYADPGFGEFLKRPSLSAPSDATTVAN